MKSKLMKQPIKPLPPEEPSEEIKDRFLERLDVREGKYYSLEELNELIEETKSSVISSNKDYTFTDFCITFTLTGYDGGYEIDLVCYYKKPNRAYQQNMKRYQLDLMVYKKKLDDYQHKMALYNQQEVLRLQERIDELEAKKQSLG